MASDEWRAAGRRPFKFPVSGKSSSKPISFERVLDALQNGALDVKGRLPYGSNFTLLALARHSNLTVPCVYKPIQGERPLWDFPSDTLALREVAAYVVSEALGWGLVPPTVYREDAPHGPGSVQFFIDAEDETHYFTLTDEQKQHLRRVAAFDLLVNNADRKGGHVIVDRQGSLWLIDHGICFHEEPKLRTVIWDFAGESLPEDIQTDLRRLSRRLKDEGSELQTRLAGLLNRAELDALCQRAERLLRHPKFPQPGPGRNYPWPPV